MIFWSLILSSLLSFAVEITPTELYSETIEFQDDLDLQELELAIDRQLKSFSQSRLQGTIQYGGKKFPKTILKETLIRFKEIVIETKSCLELRQMDCWKMMSAKIHQDFYIFRPLPAKSEQGYKENLSRFTVYYSPDFKGAKTQTERFKNPIYTLPSKKTPNYTREQIDFDHVLAGKGLEIFYVEESLYDLYLLHIQGGGRVRVQNEDGTESIRYLSYAGANSHPSRMVYHYMLAQGYLKPGKAGVWDQREYLREHPEHEREVLSQCPSYIYFNESSEEPLGIHNIPLTEGRSLAMDLKFYPHSGVLNFIRAKKSVARQENGSIQKEPFSRFFLHQDTGGAIKGRARSDLYFGYGEKAELAAYSTNDLGEQYFLIKKADKN